MAGCAGVSEHGCLIAPSTYYDARTSADRPSARELREQEWKAKTLEGAQQPDRNARFTYIMSR
jgi:hypothetical protein